MDLFILNKYTRIYFALIESRKERSLNCYIEQHHIIPKCLGGTDNDDNLIKLTPREHFIAHWLLTKMVSGTKQKYQMLKAFSGMYSWKQKRNLSSRHYEILRKNKVNKHSDEAKLKFSEQRKKWLWWNNGKINKRCEFCPGEGWVKGRLINFTRSPYSDETRKKFLVSANKRDKNHYNHLRKKCTDGKLIFDSISEMAKHYNISHSSMSGRIRGDDYPNFLFI